MTHGYWHDTVQWGGPTDFAEHVSIAPYLGSMLVLEMVQTPAFSFATRLSLQGDAGLIWFRTMRKQLTANQCFHQSDADPGFFWKRF